MRIQKQTDLECMLRILRMIGGGNFIHAHYTGMDTDADANDSSLDKSRQTETTRQSCLYVLKVSMDRYMVLPMYTHCEPLAQRTVQY